MGSTFLATKESLVKDSFKEAISQLSSDDPDLRQRITVPRPPRRPDEALLKGSLGQPIGALPKQAVNVYGPACFNYQDWMRKIKRAFDPNIASDPISYIE